MRFRLTLLAAVLAASALVPASAGARAYTAYRFRVAKVELKATTVLDGTDEGLRTTEHLTRTATVNYRGKRGDNAEYIAVPRVAFAGTLHVGHLLPVTTTESGSWTRESSSGGTESGTCGGTATHRPAQLSTIFDRRGKTIKGAIGFPTIADDFAQPCPINPSLDSVTDEAKISLAASRFTHRTVTIPMKLSKQFSGDGITETLRWDGALTLKRLAVCHTTLCLKRHP